MKIEDMFPLTKADSPYSKRVYVSQEWIDFCRKWAVGRKINNSLTEGDGPNEEELFMSKLGEVALALYLGLDPRTAVLWERIEHFDIIYNGQKFDVKASWRHYRCMIWPRAKTKVYDNRNFDHLVSVSINKNEPNYCTVDGFLTKEGFLNAKRIAPSDDSPTGMYPGTWFVFKNELKNIEEIVSGMSLVPNI